MSDVTAKQNQLVKARKAARIATCLIIFGGAVLFLYGIYTNYLPTVLEGVVLGACSLMPLIVSKYAERKLNQPSV